MCLQFQSEQTSNSSQMVSALRYSILNMAILLKSILLNRYRDGIELQLVDEDESSSPNHGTLVYSNGGATASTSNAGTRFGVNTVKNLPKFARTKLSTNSNASIRGDGSNVEATVLVVRRLTRLDSGRYECRVRNSVGAANSTNFANVRVQCKCNLQNELVLILIT